MKHKNCSSFLRPLRESSVYGWIWLFTEAIQIEFYEKSAHVCARVLEKWKDVEKVKS